MPKTDFSLEDLAHIALGSPEGEEVDVKALHCLITLLLKKLGCAKEKVYISGVEAKYCAKVLKEVKKPDLQMEHQHVKNLSEQWNKVDGIEQRINELDDLLDEHLDRLRESYLYPKPDFKLEKWDKSKSAGEEMVSNCESDDERACSLLKNVDFMVKLQRYVSAPVIKRIFHLEHATKALIDEYENYIDDAMDYLAKMNQVNDVTKEMDTLRRHIEEHHIKFLGTMEEVQDMLDSKLDKIHLPALKKYIIERFEYLEAQLTKLESQRHCRKDTDIIVGPLKCLSCANDDVCARRDNNLMLMKNWHTNKNIKFKNKSDCPCPTETHEYEIQPQMIHLYFPPNATKPKINERKRGIRCQGPIENLKLKQCDDGKNYRME